MNLKLSKQQNIKMQDGTFTRRVKIFLNTAGMEAVVAVGYEQNVSQETEYVLPVSVNGTTRVCRTADSEESRRFDSRHHVAAMG